MKHSTLRLATAAVSLTLLLGVSAHRAMADNTPGEKVTFSAGLSNVSSLFSYSGGTITVNGNPNTTGDTWFLTFGTGGTFPSGGTKQLLGISKIYLVDTSGNTVKAGPATVTNGGFVKTSAGATTKTNWFTDVENTYPRYKSISGNGGGFSTNDPWLVVGDPALAGKSGSALNKYGSFTFNTTDLSKYSIGIDYLVKDGANGQTGRAYFSYNDTLPPNNVPEPAFYQMAALLVLGGAGALRLRKTRKA